MRKDRVASYKKIMIKYTTEIPGDYFKKFCEKNMVTSAWATAHFRDKAIEAAESEIDRLLEGEV